MTPARIFVSSVQKEFAQERRAIRAFVEGDALLRRFFDVFLFEDLPASDRRADESIWRRCSAARCTWDFSATSTGLKTPRASRPRNAS